MLDYYKILELDRSATSEDVRAAKRRLAKKYHPDRNKDPGAARRMELVVIAADTLGDPDRRRDYDLELKQFLEAPSAPPRPEFVRTTPPRSSVQPSPFREVRQHHPPQPTNRPPTPSANPPYRRKHLAGLVMSVPLMFILGAVLLAKLGPGMILWLIVAGGAVATLVFFSALGYLHDRRLNPATTPRNGFYEWVISVYIVGVLLLVGVVVLSLVL